MKTSRRKQELTWPWGMNREWLFTKVETGTVGAVRRTDQNDQLWVFLVCTQGWDWSSTEKLWEDDQKVLTEKPWGALECEAMQRTNKLNSHSPPTRTQPYQWLVENGVEDRNAVIYQGEISCYSWLGILGWMEVEDCQIT